MKRKTARKSSSVREKEKRFLKLYNEKIERLRQSFKKSRSNISFRSGNHNNTSMRNTLTLEEKINSRYSPIKPLNLRKLDDVNDLDEESYFPTPRHEKERKKEIFLPDRKSRMEEDKFRTTRNGRKSSRSKNRYSSRQSDTSSSDEFSDTMIKKSKYLQRKKEIEKKKKRRKEKRSMIRKKKKKKKEKTIKDCILLKRKGNRVRLKIDVYEPRKIDLFVIDEGDGKHKKSFQRKRILVQKKKCREKKKRGRRIPKKTTDKKVKRRRRRRRIIRRNSNGSSSTSSDTSIRRRRIRVKRGRRILGTMVKTKRLGKKK